MPDADPAALDFLLSRRSHAPKTLKAPAPNRAEMERILTAAMRVPDHGMLAPWRFVVMAEAACRRVGAAILASGRDQDLEKAAHVWSVTPACVVVIESPVEGNIPPVEQTLSAGAACAALVNAALASGWGAGWVSGWAAHDHALMTEVLGIAERERVAGFVHIGTEGAAPAERARPTLADKVEWRT